MTKNQPSKKKKVDPYKGVKFLGYKLSQLPNKYSISDLVRYAKFQLAVKNKRLLKDPIWDEYTIEELLMEFFAHQFTESKEFLQAFESTLGDINGDIDDFAAWADKQMAEEAKIREKTLDTMEDSVSFNPSKDVMGEE